MSTWQYSDEDHRLAAVRIASSENSRVVLFDLRTTTAGELTARLNASKGRARMLINEATTTTPSEEGL